MTELHVLYIGVARGAPPGRRKKFGAKFTGESCKCTPRQSAPRGRARVHYLRKLGRSGRWERLLRQF